MMVGRALALGVIWLATARGLQQQQPVWRVGEAVLGPRRGRRALELRRAGEARRRQRLEEDYERLSASIAKVLKHRRRIHTAAGELATMKKEKLRVADEMAALERRARASAPAVVLGAGACGEVYAAAHAESGAPAACKVARGAPARRVLRREYDSLRRARGVR